MSESNVKIYLLDGRVLTYSISIGTRGSALFAELCNDCPLVFPKYFGLEILDKKSNFKWLRHNSYVLEELRGSNELQLAVKFYPMNSSPIDHNYTLYLFAVQIRMAVIENYLYYSTAEIVKILAMSLKIEMPHPEGSPADSLFAIENLGEDFILSIKDAVDSEYLELKDTERHVVLSSLLEYVLSINVFGSRIFECKIKIESIIYSVVLNCSPRGISINDQSHLIYCFHWNSILNIKFQDSNLQIQTRSDPEGFLIKFESRHFAQAFKVYCVEAKQFYEKEEIRAQELEYMNSRSQKRSSRFLTRFSNITKICSSNIEKNVDNSQMSEVNNLNTSLGFQNEPDWENMNNPLMLATRLHYNPTMSLYKDVVQDQGTITCLRNSKILLNCSNSTVKRLDVSLWSNPMPFNRSHSNSLACISDTPNNYRNDLDSEDNHPEPFLIKRYNSIAHLDNSVLSNNLHSISHSNPPDTNQTEHLQPEVHPEIFENNSIPKNHSIRITEGNNNSGEFAADIDNLKIVGNGILIEESKNKDEPVLDYKIVEEAPETFSRDEVIIIDQINTEDIKQLSLSPELIESMKNSSRFTCKVLKFLDHVELFLPSISNHDHSAIIGEFKFEIYDKLMSSFHSFAQLFTENADNILVSFASFDSAEFFQFLNCIIISFTRLDQEIYRYCCGLPEFFE
ncbi:MAG: FERM, ARHGEF and pleckstrin domain-containing protein 1 [Marteilia pararefringens]